MVVSRRLLSQSPTAVSDFKLYDRSAAANEVGIDDIDKLYAHDHVHNGKGGDGDGVQVHILAIEHELELDEHDDAPRS